MKFVYGPVPSRRLGQSLGVDPVPLKTCNWNCIYCQLGRTFPFALERREYVPATAVIEELSAYFSSDDLPHIDWVSFVGSGEPTLHSELGAMIRYAKQLTSIPVAVITNGTLLSLPEVRDDLMAADLVMPTLSAGNEVLYGRIHRPHPTVTFARHLEGMRTFRHGFAGKLWIEVMLMRGINDGEEALRALARRLEEIRPDQIEITLPTRPPAEEWVEAADSDGLMRAIAILGEIAPIGHPHLNGFALGSDSVEAMVEELWAILARHPMSESQIRQAVAKRAPQSVEAVLHQLAEDARVQPLQRHGVPFWASAEARFQSASVKARMRTEIAENP